MVTTTIKCPVCGGINISRNGKTQIVSRDIAVMIKNVPSNPFMVEYTCNGWKPGINEQIINMAANASGIRDTARVLGVSKQKVQDTLKKRLIP